MALSDPQSVTIDGVAISLPRVFTEGNQSRYKNTTSGVEMTVSHQYAQRTRRVVRLDKSLIVPDPLHTGINLMQRGAVYTVFDVPQMGFTPDDMLKLSLGHIGALTASTNALLKKVLEGES